MSTATTDRQFTATNLDPALAEAVDAAPPGQIIEGIVRLEDPRQVPPGFRVVSRFHRICTGRFAADQAWKIRVHPNVISLKATQPLGRHEDDYHEDGRHAGVRPDIQSDIRSGPGPVGAPLPFTGRGCIVAALDFGLDFAHPNFLRPDGTTRLMAFWHQGAAYDPARPNRFGYGRDYSRQDINAALAAADPYQALDYHPGHSDSGKGSHGTHTFDIAAGNGRAMGARAGAAPDADLMFVHLSTPRLDTAGDLGGSVRLLEALDYIDTAARGRPWVVNLSVGRTAGSHDGTSPVEQGMHELLRRGPGRAIVQSAGNYRSADLAVHGRLKDGEHRDLSWVIDPADTTANEIDAWYSGKDRFVVAIRPPHDVAFLHVGLGEVAAIVHEGSVVGRIYHRKNDPNNGDNHVEAFLYPNAPSGVWTLRLVGDYVINGRYHAWIERDLARRGAQSRFDAGVSSPAYTLGTIATSPLVITVGAYDGHADGAPLAPFSSCGPTRDDRYDKPELLAPGVDVLAARSIPRGAARQEGLLVERSGTSMAAPHVAGTVAAMFEAAGRPVTIDVIRACLKKSARPHTAADQAGCCAWGRLDTQAAIREIQAWREPEPALASGQPAVQWIDAAEIASADEVTGEVTDGVANEPITIDSGTTAIDEVVADEVVADEVMADEVMADEDAANEAGADVELLDRPTGTAQAFGSDERDRAEDEADGTKAAVDVLVVDEQGRAVIDGSYTAWQGTIREAGSFTAAGKGMASLKSIDPAKPFVFEVGDRVCAIRGGAFIDPDDKAIEYGGTWFDWTLVRDDDQPDTKFWPHYRREMDLAAGIDEARTATGRRVDRFLQHEHVNRRPLHLTRAVRGGQGKLQIVASPTRLRAGPLLRYTDHRQAVVWLETVTPAMVRVRCVRVSDGLPSMHWASTVRVGGRYFAAVEVTGLEQQTIYRYTVDLAPLPGYGAVPVTPEAIAKAFPTLSSPVGDAMTSQLKPISLDGTGWLVFRTLRPKYEDRLRFATGSCRWYPGDLKNGKDWGPDMLVGLGKWLAAHRNDREKWPDFLFFGGDQIYADEIGDDHGAMLVRGRFAARVPGPVDPAPTAQGKLVDGAWAGRFAHRYKTYKDPEKTLVDRVRTDFRKLDELDRRYPEIRDFYLRYAKSALTEKEQRELSHRLMMALVRALGGKITDQKTYDRARELVRTAETLNRQSGSYRAFLPHWDAGLDPGMRRNPMLRRFLVHNFLLWDVPTFDALLPRVIDSSNLPIVQPSERGHISPAGGRHAGDFTEYAYLYERAWAGCPEVRPLLAHIPTFLMLDDHEATDDWNCSLPWARMLHNKNDALRMWPKTLTDSLAAYWMYQGWCNKAPSQWPKEDRRIRALDEAHRAGRDALPELRRCIHDACFKQEPTKATFQTGLGLDWHYKLPFDPPFLVPDCRTRRFMVESDEDLRVIDHDSPRRPSSQTIDAAQLDWMRKILVKRGGPSVAFIAPSTPLLLQKKVMEIMTKPETTAEAWDTARRAALGLPELPSLIAATSGSTRLGVATNALLRIFRRAKDLEHMIRDRSWRDLWDLVDSMRQAGSAVKTLVVVSGDVHHNYCMTGNLSAGGRPKPEILQITCSGLQTEIRSSAEKWLAEKLGSRSFNVGKRRLVPGFMIKNRTGKPDLALFQNAVAIVEVSMSAEVGVQVRFLSGAHEHIYRYTSGAAYMRNGEPTLSPWQQAGAHLDFQDIKRGAEATESDFDPGEDKPTDDLTVSIIVDQPGETDDRFQLVSNDGRYSKTLGAGDAEALTAGARILRFKVPSTKALYTLIHQRAKGSRQTIFRNRRVQDLTKAGTRPQTARYSYARLDSKLPSTLPAAYRVTAAVDPDLVQGTPVLADLRIEDPEL
ncbi:MAG: S8 family serine peptidase [Reyranella sp.]|nr:S8 family serine peptidase [Reyranella sp.]